MYEGRLVRLRGFRDGDEQYFAEWMNDESFSRLAAGGGRMPMTEAGAREWISWHESDAFAVETLDDSRLIGVCTYSELQERSGSCRVGFMVGSESDRGRGYGADMAEILLTFLFREKNLRKVGLEVLSFNGRAVALYERLGFVREAVYRDRVFTDGCYWDEYAYGMLREEFEARHAGIDSRFVYLDEAVPGVTWDAKYATCDNLTGAPLNGYRVNRVVGARELAEGLLRAQKYFAEKGYGLHLYDGYRPVRAVRSLAAWAKRPEDSRTKAAHYPNHGKTELFPLGYIAEKSGHSRGGSIDLTLTKDGRELDMGGIFDLMDDVSHHGYPVPEPAYGNRLLLKQGMEACGFHSYENEWWHYNLAQEPYPDQYFDFPIQ